MYRTFNMGVGMVIVCSSADAPSIKNSIEAHGETCYEVGRVIAGQRQVNLV
jgi:phosphoribosylformylglycinamidine cyclo-ligase